MKEQRYCVTGMTCSACSAHVEKAVGKVEGVEKVEVNLLQGTMKVTGEAPESVVVEAVEKAGYGAQPGKPGRNERIFFRHCQPGQRTGAYSWQKALVVCRRTGCADVSYHGTYGGASHAGVFHGDENAFALLYSVSVDRW